MSDEKICRYCQLPILNSEYWIRSPHGYVHSDERRTCVSRLLTAVEMLKKELESSQRLTNDP